jgi:hypothetical protein
MKDDGIHVAAAVGSLCGAFGVIATSQSGVVAVVLELILAVTVLVLGRKMWL